MIEVKNVFGHSSIDESRKELNFVKIEDSILGLVKSIAT